MKQLKLKIVSDGTTNGTYVEDIETGARLAGVSLLSWSANADQTETEATLHLWGVPCEIIADVGTMIADNVLDDASFPLLSPEYKDAVNGKTIDITELLKSYADAE